MSIGWNGTTHGEVSQQIISVSCTGGSDCRGVKSQPYSIYVCDYKEAICLFYFYNKISSFHSEYEVSEPSIPKKLHNPR